MPKVDIRNLAKDRLAEALSKIGAEPYRADQVFKWLYGRGVTSFDEMTDLPADFRQKLKDSFRTGRLIEADRKRSSIDGTTKYLFKLFDSNTIESVFLPERDRSTLCISSQVGCKYGCSFCASAPFGFVRNLTQSEIVGQAISIRARHTSSRITNIVFMGIGEPLDNYDNVIASIRIFNDKDAFNIGARKITVSTCGIIPGIERLAKEDLQIELSVSLHSADNAVRTKIVPVNSKYPLKSLMIACRNYVKDTNRIITFEYVLISGVNSSKADALSLARLLKTVKCKVNIISYNKTAAYEYGGPLPEDARAFAGIIKKEGVNTIIRKPKGQDISAGCGQLRISRMVK